MYFSKSTITNTDNLPLVLTVSEVMKILGIGKNTAYELIRSGAVKSVRAGRQARVPKSVFLECFKKYYWGKVVYTPRLMYNDLRF